MFSRLRDGLFAPTEVIKYRNDPWWISLLFFLMLGILSASPGIIYTSQAFQLDYEKQIYIRNEFKMEPLPFVLEGHELKHINGNNDFVYERMLFDTLQIIISVNKQETPTLFDATPTIYFTKDKVYFYQSASIARELFSYQKYESLENLDLTLVEMNDLELWNTIFFVTTQEMVPFRPLYLTLNIINVLLYALLKLAGFSLLFTLLQKMSAGSISFSSLWKCILYVMSPYIICEVLAALYGLSLLVFIGIIATVMHASKVSRALSNPTSRGNYL